MLKKIVILLIIGLLSISAIIISCGQDKNIEITKAPAFVESTIAKQSAIQAAVDFTLTVIPHKETVFNVSPVFYNKLLQSSRIVDIGRRIADKRQKVNAGKLWFYDRRFWVINSGGIGVFGGNVVVFRGL